MEILTIQKRVSRYFAKIFIINLYALILYLVSLLLAKNGFPYFTYIMGIAVFFMPGLNLAYIVEQITKQKQGMIRMLLWGFLFSLFFIPLLVYLVATNYLLFANDGLTLNTFYVFWTITILLTFIFSLFNKTDPIKFAVNIKKDKLLIISIGIFLLLMATNFIAYPYIPEADGYGYLVETEKIIRKEISAPREARTLFVVLSWTVSFITKIQPYWLYKIVFPLFGAPLILIFYQLSRSISDSRLRTLASLSVFFFPVVMAEILVTRPQIIFLITLPIVLFLLTETLKYRLESNYRSNIHYFLLLIIISLIGIKFHELFAILIFICIVSLVYFLWPAIKKNLFESVIIIISLSILMLPWLEKTGLLFMINHFLSPFINVIKHPHFNLWFIDNYTNTDGNEVGWPGYTWLLYYGYNFGLIAPVLTIFLFIKRKEIDLKIQNAKVYFLSAGIFFAIAEIFPRIGLAFLPDRAWLFCVVSLSFLIPIILQQLSQKLTLKTNAIFIIALIVATFILTWIINFIKEGWTSRNEYKAMQFIKNTTHKSSIILSQGGNSPGIMYFAERKLAIPNQQFVGSGELIDLLISDYDPTIKMQFLQNEKNQLVKKIQQEQEDFFQADNLPKRKEIINRQNIYFNQYIESIKKIETLNNQIINQQISGPPSVYLFYSEEKFKNIYNIRNWWKDFNLYQLDVKKFEKYPLIYHQNGIYLWEIK